MAVPAGRLAKMKEEEWDFLYALTGDKESEKRLKDFVFYHGLRLALRERWKTEGSGLIERMSEMAVREILHPRCRSCNGTSLDNKLLPCPYCNAIGIGRLSGRALSEKIGVDYSRFNTLWQYRYDCLFVFVQDIQGNVVSIIRQTRNKKAILLA
jgi:hypothetical protein